MNVWIERATRTGSVLSGCKAARVSMVDVNDARHKVPEFNEAFRLYEEIADLLILDLVRQFALAGNTNGMRYYFHVVREHVLRSQVASAPLSPEQAEILLREALDAVGDPVDHLAC